MENWSSLFDVKCEEGELSLSVGGKVWGRMSRKKTVQSSITSMGFPLLEKPGEMCPDRQIDVSGKFWNFNRDRIHDEEANTLFKCTVHGFHTSEVVKCFRRTVSYSPCILLFSNRLCVTWQPRPMWNKFSHGRDNFQKLILTPDHHKKFLYSTRTRALPWTGFMIRRWSDLRLDQHMIVWIYLSYHPSDISNVLPSYPTTVHWLS